MKHAARRIMKLAAKLGAKSYLEVGVAHGQTFFDVAIASKVAVDPRFRFDAAQHRSATAQYFEMTSDEWFTTAPRTAFDIIFLDGLHEFGQTFRDFCSSQAFAHRGTVWLIDDTVPVDIYSAWPVHREAIDLRRKSGRPSGQWHGDIYKVVFAIADYFPTMNFCTLPENNPQTLVWFEARPDFKPRFKSLEAIERLTYFDFVRMKDEFRFRDEDTGIELAAAGSIAARA
jgi:hypothetical protein